MIGSGRGFEEDRVDKIGEGHQRLIQERDAKQVQKERPGHWGKTPQTRERHEMPDQALVYQKLGTKGCEPDFLTDICGPPQEVQQQR
jgi:hypothetical protein